MTQTSASFQSDAACHFGVSRARVSQLLALLTLPADVISALDQLCKTPQGRRFFSERRLRTLTTLGDQQVTRERFQRMVDEFEGRAGDVIAMQSDRGEALRP